MIVASLFAELLVPPRYPARLVRLASALALVLVAVSAACSGEDPECNGFGCSGSADDGTTVTTTDSASATAADDGSSSAATTLESTSGASEATATAGTTTEAPSDTSATSGDASSETGLDESSGPPCDGPSCPTLGECFGLGVWESCTQYCQAGKASCVESGCGGATVVFYDDANGCIDMAATGESAQSCDDGFAQGGGASFGRCCCE